jgi:hypothetical protein
MNAREIHVKDIKKQINHLRTSPVGIRKRSISMMLLLGSRHPIQLVFIAMRLLYCVMRGQQVLYVAHASKFIIPTPLSLSNHYYYHPLSLIYLF